MWNKTKSTVSAYLVGIVLMMSACSDEGDLVSEDVSFDEVAPEAVLDFSGDDIDNIVLNNMSDLFTSGVTGEANGGKRFNPYSGRDDCASVTKDLEAQTIVIDFGVGCENSDSIIRSGQILISYTDRRNEPGAVITTTFNNFFINGNQIEGVRTLSNISDGTVNQKAFQVSVVGGQVTFEDGTTKTFESSRTRTHVLDEAKEELTVTVTGSRSGTNRENEAFSMTIIQDLIYLSSCKQEGVKVPASGIREFVKNGETTTIDYGLGTCDN
jgi:hypothetical protein